ncbi:UDP-N-acetylmuramoyl-L-alanyl-D-glutamate--2,6-diaminopimelate ligase [Marinivivus vitaminiproducens]|uniref:UDP-N-acetylmuramoyl-L-alanyl-D-glutamate--2, 6-diaminopimelate ligase n=1 Tax=Marinivivus vitaminiproducens TaxID=3035935 RepID=UPI0027A30A3F|nr:UDP-N-acetylmuramoyl-L-alanyl-D-glutamate--2,6-diaminopimelate ligase [Geminicoccaceae bacterium SCSIO 64248]
MRLSALRSERDRLGGRKDLDPVIAHLSCDSRTVEAGALFAAFPGARADGRSFVEEALSKGAVALLLDPTVAADSLPVPAVIAANPRQRFAGMAAAFFGRQPATVLAVTGTNGKTSVAEFTRQLLAAQAVPAASIGTLGLRAGGLEGALPPIPSLTTQDSVTLHRVLAALAEAGVEHVALEASSHGLDQYRLDGVSLAAAAFTNATHDHLDYHGTFEAYLAAKVRLFAELLPEGATAVLNADQPEIAALEAVAQLRGLRTLTFGARGRDIRLLARTPLPEGQSLRLAIGPDEYDVALGLVGAFQAYNAMAALGLLIATGQPVEPLLAALPDLKGAPGRMQKVGVHRSGAVCFVDYAHTPDALETALAALRPHAGGRLVVVFGCGGDRDRAKRPLMGAIAARLADRAIVTDDNPRTEDAAAIRSAILAACPGGVEIGDRAEAIQAGARDLEAGDILLVAGKGHETGQIVGATVHPFDDADVLGRALAEVGGGA